MNFQNMEYFIVVAEEGNITKAAERLHVSQQALSNQIARMEEELGCVLFTRHPSLELTYSGKTFLKSVVQILDIKRQTTSAIDDINHNVRGELKIGISHTRGQAILPILVPAFKRIYPLVELRIIESNTKVLEEDLDKGDIDVLIGFKPFMLENAEAMELMRERLFLVAPRELLKSNFGSDYGVFCDKYREHPDLTLFSNLPFVLLRSGERIRTLVDKEFYKCGISPVIVVETQNIQTAVSLAAEGLGLTVCSEMYLNSRYTACGMPDSYIRQRVEILPFFSDDARDTIAIGYNRERYLSHIAQDFINMSLEIFANSSTYV